MSDDEPEESSRQLKRRQQRADGKESARLARKLMTLPASTLPHLGLDRDLRDAVDRARTVTAHSARRRAERSLAGDLRAEDLADLQTRIAKGVAAGSADQRLFKLAETWRARLIEESDAAAEFPYGAQPELLTLIHQARRERDTGKPRNARRALFRHVFAALKAEHRSAAAETVSGSHEDPT